MTTDDDNDDNNISNKTIIVYFNIVKLQVNVVRHEIFMIRKSLIPNNIVKCPIISPSLRRTEPLHFVTLLASSHRDVQRTFSFQQFSSRTYQAPPSASMPSELQLWLLFIFLSVVLLVCSLLHIPASLLEELESCFRRRCQHRPNQNRASPSTTDQPPVIDRGIGIVPPPPTSSSVRCGG